MGNKTNSNRPPQLYKKGQSGNPKGRPKGSTGVSVVAALKRKLNEYKGPQGTERKKVLDHLVERIIEKAIEEGDVAMMKDIVDRIDGKPKQVVESPSLEKAIPFLLGDVSNNLNDKKDTESKE